MIIANILEQCAAWVGVVVFITLGRFLWEFITKGAEKPFEGAEKAKGMKTKHCSECGKPFHVIELGDDPAQLDEKNVVPGTQLIGFESLPALGICPRCANARIC